MCAVRLYVNVIRYHVKFVTDFSSLFTGHYTFIVQNQTCLQYFVETFATSNITGNTFRALSFTDNIHFSHFTILILYCNSLDEIFPDVKIYRTYTGSPYTSAELKVFV